MPELDLSSDLCHVKACMCGPTFLGADGREGGVVNSWLLKLRPGQPECEYAHQAVGLYIEKRPIRRAVNSYKSCLKLRNRSDADWWSYNTFCFVLFVCFCLCHQSQIKLQTLRGIPGIM